MEIFTAEVIGTGILIVLGDGVVAGVLLARSKAENAGWIVITFGWGMAVAMAVYAVGQFSGAHLNPAVTIGFAVTDVTPWDDVPKYLAGEFTGAFLGAIIVYLSYLPHWRVTEDPGLKLAVFCTAPAIRNRGANLLTEIVGTFMLLFGVFAIVGHFAAAGSGSIGQAVLATAFGQSIVPLLIGLLVFAIGLSLGGPTGYAINPARDLSPRIAHALLPIPGKRDADWDYAWIPVVGPIIGGVLGAVTYQALFAPGTGNLEVIGRLSGML
ncbi:MAG TPA: MIP/aquaporin family protein [Gaiellaceae bacterium]|jgi:glycerol uptake facilitator protein|nr:MIP/aquaporin family protein [Gaiellaceae bacterium]